MPDQFLIIKLDNTQIYLANNISFTYEKTNLPKNAFSFKPEKELFWKIEEKHYDSVSEILTVNVVDYNSTEDLALTKSELQNPIKTLNFEKLDWEKFEPLIYSYTLSKLKNIIYNYRERFSALTVKQDKESKIVRRPPLNTFFDKPELVKQEKEIEMRVKYEDALFDTSKIVFPIYLKLYKYKNQIEIINPIFRPELEHIKQYFVRRFGAFFLVKIKLKLQGNEVVEVFAESDDINSINESVIRSIEVSSILDLKHFKPERDDKILYSTKELSAEIPKISLSDKSAKDILEIFIENSKVKNLKQLEYLAKDRQTLSERVLFTIKPMFGFLFHEFGNIECFIWELLNSHATYVWKFNRADSSLDLGKVVEQAIATIKNDGREAYKRYYKTIDNPGYDFDTIEHLSEDLTENERFEKWRHKLERFCS